MAKPLGNDDAFQALKHKLVKTRKDHGASSSTLSKKDEAVFESLSPLFPQHKKIVSGILGSLKPDSTLRTLASSHGLEDLTALANNSSHGTSKHKIKSASHDGHAPTSPDRDDAVAFRRRLFALEPTGIIQRMVMDDDAGPFPNETVRHSVARFIENQPQSFDIRRTLLRSAFRRKNAFTGIPAENQSDVSSALKSLQTTLAMTDRPEAIKPMREIGLSTAFAVSSMSESAFTQAMNGKLDDNVAKDIHRRAINSRVQNDHALVSLLQTTRGTGIAALDGTTTLEQRKNMLTDHLHKAIDKRGRDMDRADNSDDDDDAEDDPDPKPVVDLEALFGSLDYCECSDCNSINSPAAYFVELLQFLRNNNLHWDMTKWPNSGKPGIEGTALEALFARRPDLGNIQLTCENTNTILPYIDLANEVMESFVEHKQKYVEDKHKPKRLTLDVFNIDDETSSELLAQPQHTNYTAYCILRDAVYPIVNAPYHQALDEARILLEFMKTSRYELITTFASKYSDDDNSNESPAERGKLLDQHHQTLERIATSEFWKMSQTEYIAITRESYWSKEFWIIKKKAAISDDDYLTHIKRKKAWIYWGFDTEAAMQSTDPDAKTGLMFVKKQLLQRAYVTYEDLVNLIKTRYTNPNMPTGWSRVVLESIRFSYQYLVPLVDKKQHDPCKKYRHLAQFLAYWKPWAKETGVEVNDCDNICLSETDILCWLKTWFEAIGKIVVLESGDVPRLPIEGHLVLHTTVNIPALALVARAEIPPLVQPSGSGWEDLGYLDREGTVRRQDGNMVAFVAPDSTLRDADGTLYVTHLKHLQTLYIVDPALTSFENEQDISQNHIIANVQADTSLVTWNVPFGRKDPPAVHYLAATETCNIDRVTVQHLDGTPLTADEWDRMQAFLRLWRRLGWSINEVDQALSGITQSSSQTNASADKTPDTIEDWNQVIDSGGCLCQACGHTLSDCCCSKPKPPEEDCCNLAGPDPPMYITPAVLEQLVAIKQLLDLGGLDLIQLLTLWYDISIEGSPSLYSKLFLVHSVSGIDPVFKANAEGSYLSTSTKISSHLAVITAALRINAETLAVLMADGAIEDDLSLGNISRLYKYVVLGRLLNMKPILIPRVIKVCGQPFFSPRATLDMVKLWQQIRDKGYTLPQIDYLINNRDDDPLKPLGPTTATILKATKTMIDGISKVNAEHADVNETETTAAILTNLSSKIPLIFEPDVTAAILALINGTTVYSTDAPPNLTITVPENMKAKLQYSTLKNMTPVRATLQVTGILTVEEASVAKALSNSNDWSAALERVAKKPGRFFDEVLFGIFSNKDEAKAVLLQGDVPALPPPPPVPTDVNSTGTGTSGSNAGADQTIDKSTARPKSLFFLQGLLPFLRMTLADQVIIETVSEASSISDAETRVLLLTKLITDSESQFGIHTLRNIVKSPPTYDSSFQGYLIPSTSDDFTFVAGGFSQEPPALSIDKQQVRLQHRQDDPTNVWYSDPVNLVSGKLYDFVVTGQPALNVQWKTPRLPISNIPASALLPGYASESVTTVFEKLYKAGLVINVLGLTASEVGYFSANPDDFSHVDFNEFTIDTWKRMADYTTLRDSLPMSTMTLIDFFKWAKKPDEAERLPKQISTVTNWKEDMVAKLIAKDAFNMTNPKSFVSETELIKLQKALVLQERIGVDPDVLFHWSKPLSFFWKESRQIAESIHKALRSRYDVTTWEQVAEPLFNKLRANQRDALIAFLLVQDSLRKWGVTDADSLFEFFLIDVQMGACLQTSRIKQAISSVQLFVQRCLLALEIDHGLDGFLFDRGRWEWMSRYRVWEANRKVFLWPENWLEPTLRDDKSEIFLALEAQLLQKDLSPDALQGAIKDYLNRVDQVSCLQVVGLVVDEGPRVLHIFAKTVTAPFSFFYRRYKSYVKTPGDWSPWETMQVDINTYEQEDNTGRVEKTGSFVLPVVWNGRLLAFLPEFSKKTVPVRAEDDKTTIQESGGRPLNASTPATYWAIKMGYTEYRNGKWTPKKLSTGEVAKLPEPPQPPADGSPAPPPTAPKLLPISSYRFVPKIFGTAPDTTIVIGVFSNEDTATIDTTGSAQSGVGWFQFDGGQVLTSSLAGTFAVKHTLTEFQFSIGSLALQMHSYQDDPATTEPLDYISEDPVAEYPLGTPLKPTIATGGGNTYDFYDRYSRQLLARASTAPTVEGIYDFYRNLTDLDGLAAAFGNAVKPATPFASYHELKTPYAIYNWEIGLHAPMLLMNKLLSLQQFDKALEVAHWVFDPFAKRSPRPVPGDLWQFPPFKNVLAENELEKTFAMLDPNMKVQEGSVIDEWRENPFEPHVVARARRQAYMKWFALRYIEILIAYGDWYFMQNTLETIPMAIQLYVQASHLYGPRAQRIPRRGKKKIQTFNSLLDQWDGFGNAVVQMELAFPFSQQSTKPLGQLYGKNVLANIFGFATSRYFCIPNNPRLDEVRNLIDDRLYKIRHCQDINGVVRQLPLFEPPIDPGLLVQAAAAGLSFASVVSDLNTPISNYRFHLLLQKALELCNELKGMAGTLLSVKEKRDAEALSNLRARHEVTVGGLAMELKKQALEDANLSLQAARQSRLAPVFRMKYFLQLLGEDMAKLPEESDEFTEIQNRFEALTEGAGFKLLPSEKLDMDKANDAAAENFWIGQIEALSSFLHMIPTTDIHGTPWGLGGAIKWGPASFAQGAAATARKMRIGTESMTAEASNANRMTNFLRQVQDRVYQANNAGYEIKTIDAQILVQEQKVRLAEQDITNQQQLLDNAAEVRDFLSGKYTNEALYAWMESSISSLYYQTYTLAYQLAKRAERAFAFERGLDASQANFISFGYWDASRAGLLAAERLYVGLKQLEAAHQADRGHDYEITKHISLRQVAPLALVRLRESSACDLTLPEVLFDMDFPGHYQRRIKSVALSIPCVVGPYTSISCTLRLLSSELRVAPTAGSAADYPRTPDDQDPRFRTITTVPVSAIAVSSATNDSGTFELGFRDERYAPFEGAGAAHSRWRLELPAALRAWDYGSIADVVLHLRYTAREGGTQLAAAASGAVRDFMRRAEAEARDEGLFAVFDLRAEFAAEWSRVVGPLSSTTAPAPPPPPPRALALRGIADRLPPFARVQQRSSGGGGSMGGVRRVTAQDVWVLLSSGSWVDGVELLDPAGDATELPAEVGGQTGGGMATFKALGIGVEVGDWVLNFRGAAGGAKLTKGVVVVRYTVS